MSIRTISHLFTLFFFFTTHFGMAVAQETSSAALCKPANIKTGIRPNAGGAPTNVTVAIYIADFLGVNDVDQQLDLDIYVEFSWFDPRLADKSGCRYGRTEVWFPQILLKNSSNLRALFNNALNQVSVGGGGKITYRQRLTGNISSYHNLKRFPFDSHDFKINLIAAQGSINELVFLANNENTAISKKLNIEGWDILGINLEATTEKLAQSGEHVSGLTLTISAKRNPDYFLYRVLLLLMFVVAMSWTIFWIPPSRFEFQIGLGATSMLTSIAFNLSVANNLPKLGYLTILDKTLIWAIFLIFLSIVEALFAGLLVLKKRDDVALRIDKVSRVLFPVLLFSGYYVIINTA